VAGAFLTDDLSTMMSVEEFASEVFIAGLPVNAIFDAEYVAPLEMASVGPVLTCNALDVVGVLSGWSVVVDTVAYTVRDVQPDGTGIVRLILERN
jgi:hypothetical protein